MGTIYIKLAGSCLNVYCIHYCILYHNSLSVHKPTEIDMAVFEVLL